MSQRNPFGPFSSHGINSIQGYITQNNNTLWISFFNITLVQVSHETCRAVIKWPVLSAIKTKFCHGRGYALYQENRQISERNRFLIASENAAQAVSLHCINRSLVMSLTERESSTQIKRSGPKKMRSLYFDYVIQVGGLELMMVIMIM